MLALVVAIFGAAFTLALFDKFFTYNENHGEPLIEVPDDADHTLFAYTSRKLDTNRENCHGHGHRRRLPQLRSESA